LGGRGGGRKGNGVGGVENLNSEGALELIITAHETPRTRRGLTQLEPYARGPEIVKKGEKISGSLAVGLKKRIAHLGIFSVKI